MTAYPGCCVDWQIGSVMLLCTAWQHRVVDQHLFGRDSVFEVRFLLTLYSFCTVIKENVQKIKLWAASLLREGSSAFWASAIFLFKCYYFSWHGNKDKEKPQGFVSRSATPLTFSLRISQFYITALQSSSWFINNRTVSVPLQVNKHAHGCCNCVGKICWVFILLCHLNPKCLNTLFPWYISDTKKTQATKSKTWQMGLHRSEQHVCPREHDQSVEKNASTCLGFCNRFWEVT